MDINNVYSELSQKDIERIKRISDFVEDIESGKHDLPKSCSECPAKSFDLSYFVMDICMLNVDTYVGDMFFGSHGKRPKWCPLKKYRGESDDENRQQDDGKQV